MVEMDRRARHESNLPTRERVMGQRGVGQEDEFRFLCN